MNIKKTIDRLFPSSTKMLLKEINNLKSMLLEANKKIEKQEKRNVQLQRTINEIEWSQVFRDTIKESKWFQRQQISPGRWAVGYPFLYVLYRVLDSEKPIKILEMGLGQSTRMIAQYAASDTAVNHLVLEESREFMESFLGERSEDELTNTSIVIIGTELVQYKQSIDPVKAYNARELEKAVGNNRFDFICIDAPSCRKEDKYHRIDILRLIPDFISEKFVIMMDDAERDGEKNTEKEIDNKLEENGIRYYKRKYSGKKDVLLWCSEENRYLCTL